MDVSGNATITYNWTSSSSSSSAITVNWREVRN
jgi:hypothetical protein